MKKVGIVMGSDSDLPILEKAMNMLKSLEVPYEVHVYSAHRTPDQAIAFARGAEENGFGVLIAAAGMAAHLAGVIAANTWTVWMRFLQRCRCPRVFRWQRLPSTAAVMLLCWRVRCWPFQTMRWQSA